jgi:hypothetical protein
MFKKNISFLVFTFSQIVELLKILKIKKHTMKNSKGIIALVSLSLFITSCASHIGSFTSSASLSAPNFRYVKLVKGETEISKILGFGGLSTEALVSDAKINMFQNYPLKDNQAYANISVDFKNSNFLVVTKTKVTITADIIEFIK